MTLMNGLALAARSMRRHRLRTFLMTLGVTVGIASLTILSSLGAATRQETMARFKRMVGTFDTVIVRPGSGAMRGMPSVENTPATLTFADAAAVATIPGITRVALVQTAFNVDVIYRDRSDTPGVFGVSANWTALRDDEVATGVFFSEEDVRARARVAVIGTDVERTLFGGADPLEQTLRIGNVPFLVKGVLTSRGAGPTGASLDNVIMIPVTTASTRLFNRDALTMAIAQLEDPLAGDAAMQRITVLLRQRHHIVPPALDDFTLTSPRAAMDRILAVGATLRRLMIGVAAMAMLIGGVVIMSLMLVGVSERQREIGLRRSVGASRVDILVQFLIEALAISCLGGGIGILVGLGGTEIVTRLQHLPPVLVWDPFALAVALSVALGLMFGSFPAWKAARVDPIGALRS
ncbi:MAG TPA: ABC transporter permease [Vicinamibacterales bacterium]|jgi:putative ABC transport system permease protein